jgi:hypothetical protein
MGCDRAAHLGRSLFFFPQRMGVETAACVPGTWDLHLHAWFFSFLSGEYVPLSLSLGTANHANFGPEEVRRATGILDRVKLSLPEPMVTEHLPDEASKQIYWGVSQSMRSSPSKDRDGFSGTEKVLGSNTMQGTAIQRIQGTLSRHLA